MRRIGELCPEFEERWDPDPVDEIKVYDRKTYYVPLAA
jgi:hypothetical protein